MSNPAAPHRLVTAAEQADPRGALVRALLLFALIVGWTLLIRHFEQGDVYVVIGPFAGIVIAVSLASAPRRLLHDLRPTARSVAAGLGVGVGMTLLTYPAFRLGRMLFPALDRNVRDLYGGAHSTALQHALLWVSMILVAEELLFRGAFPDALRRFMHPGFAYALSLLCYVVAQLGTGSWIVGLMALVCGLIWTGLRTYTGSLLAPIVAHFIWTPTVILLYPVT